MGELRAGEDAAWMMRCEDAAETRRRKDVALMSFVRVNSASSSTSGRRALSSASGGSASRKVLAAAGGRGAR